MRGFVDSFRASSNSLYSRVTSRQAEEEDEPGPSLLDLDDEWEQQQQQQRPSQASHTHNSHHDDAFSDFAGASSSAPFVKPLAQQGHTQQQQQQQHVEHHDDAFGDFAGASSSGPFVQASPTYAQQEEQQQVEEDDWAAFTGHEQQQQQQEQHGHHSRGPSLAAAAAATQHRDDDHGPVGLLAAAYHGQEDDDVEELRVQNRMHDSRSRQSFSSSSSALDPPPRGRASSRSGGSLLGGGGGGSSEGAGPSSTTAAGGGAGGGAGAGAGGGAGPSSGFQSAFDRYGTFPSLDDSDDRWNDNGGGSSSDGGFAGDHRNSGALGSRPSSSCSGQQQRRSGSGWGGGGTDDDGSWDPDYENVPVYVVPLYGPDSMVVVPAPKRAPPKESQSDIVRGVVQQGKKVQKKMAETWDSLKESDPDSIKNKIYRTGQAQLESLSPEQRLLGGVPEYARRLTVIHAPCVDHEEVLSYMGRTIREVAHVQRYKQIGTAALLPVTAIVDAVVIPGPGVMTGLTGYHLYHASKAVAGAQRLKRFVDREVGGNRDEAEEDIMAGGDGRDDDGMDFVVEERMLHLYDRSLRDEFGLLPKDVVDALCAELNAPPALAEVLQQLRRRELRARQKKAGQEVTV